MPEWRWQVLYQVKNSEQKARASSSEPKRAGKVGRYLRVRNWDSLKGLSLLTWGRLWVRSMPRSASRRATGERWVEHDERVPRQRGGNAPPQYL